VHVVVPAGWADPARPSGGNRYDQRVCAGLPDHGWTPVVHEVDGSWPRPSQTDLLALATVLADIPRHAPVLVDGLVGSAASDVLVPEADRLRLVALVHLPLGDAAADPVAADAEVTEHEVLEAAAAVVTTSRWTRRRLLDHYGLWPGKVHVAEPGVDEAAAAVAHPGGGQLACLSALLAHKGHDTLLRALGQVSDLDWHLTCAGSLDRDPAVASSVRELVTTLGLEGRVTLTGALPESRLADVYAQTDLVVVPSRAESYGLVLTEALARGIPVLASDVGGIPEALGRAPDDTRPGVLLPVDDVDAWAHALRVWLTDPEQRAAQRRSALGRRESLRPWSATAQRLATVLEGVT
jgi:glycosyltransferase involved in cell wall biosynthesis